MKNCLLWKGLKTVNSIDIPVSNQTDLTESENSVFVDPNNADYILNSNNSTGWDGTSYTTLYGANYFQSSNGGATWGGSYQGAGGTNRGDPTTAIGLNGRQYVNYISSASGQGIAYSDNGTSWSTATVAPNPGSLADKNHMWIDNSPSSSHEGNLYCAWTDFGGSDDAEIKINRSINDGPSWSTPVNISSSINAGSHNQGVNIQTGPNGEVYVTWSVYDSWPSDETAIAFTKSTDGGTNYQTASRILSNIKGIRTTETSKNHRVNSFPVMAVDISGGANNGNIYIVWSNVGTPGINSGTNISVYMIRSINGGTSWSTPVRVNQGTFVNGKEAYFPWITCDPVTGTLSVVFYDDRNVSSSDCETFVSNSFDAGNTWTDFVVSDVSFTPSAIPGLAGGYMGDYLGITAKGGKVYPCWTDTRGGLFMTYVSPFVLGLNAEFIADDTEICTGSSVSFTDLSSGNPSPISWSWTFTGGSPSSYNGQNPPPITYSSPGNYTVSLTVFDGTEYDTETKTNYITVKNVVADFTGFPTTVVVGNTVTFTDNSDCSPTNWSWSFPGGSPASFNGQNPPAITYNTEGTYNVTLTVTNGSGNDTKVETDYITVIPPEFNMQNGTVTTCMGNFYDSGGPSGNYTDNENFVMTFYPATSGAMLQFNFTTFSIEYHSTCSYDYLNIYDGENTSATLIGQYCGTNSPGFFTATNPAGAITFQFHSDYSVTGPGWVASISCYSTSSPPVANFSADDTTPDVGQTVNFTDLSLNAPTSWTWLFNPTTITYVGGTNSSSQNPQVQFNTLGQYTVSLTATNTYGNDTETKTNYINAVAAPPSIPPYVDDFEPYTSGNYLAVQSPFWTTWTDQPGSSEDGLISTDYAQSGTQSVKVDGLTDLILPLGDKTSGKYMVSFYMYIPSGYYGYYNLLHLFNGTSSQWGLEVFFNSGGSGYGNAGGANSFTFTYSYNTWMYLQNIVDLDNDWAEIWYEGTLLHEFQWSSGALGDGTLNQLGGLDMYAWNVNGTPLYYFDDMSYFEIVQLDLNVLLEGPYNEGTGLMNTDLNIGNYVPLSQPFNVTPWNYNGAESVVSITDPTIVDWVLVELRDATSADQASASTIIDRKAAFVKNNGQVVDIDGNTVMEFKAPFFDNLFVVAYHLNHLGVICANGLTKTGSLYDYNFSTGAGQARGGVNAHNEIAPGIWGLAGGDGNRNGDVGLSDKIVLWETEAGTKGYLPSDYNLDSESNNKDKDDIWVPNLGMGTQVPN